MSNIGQVGIESIRLNGQEIKDLPIGESARAKAALPEAIEVDKENRRNNIRAQFPKQNVGYLKGRITEANDNIVRMRTTRGASEKLINEYTALISMCEFRDKELAKLDPMLASYEQSKKELLKQFPPYNVEAMQQQIVQSKESIENCEKVIIDEQETITEFRSVLALCEQRDRELANVQ